MGSFGFFPNFRSIFGDADLACLECHLGLYHGTLVFVEVGYSRGGEWSVRVKGGVVGVGFFIGNITGHMIWGIILQVT